MQPNRFLIALDRFRCTLCGDEMNVKFRKSHERICAHWSCVCRERVERFLESLDAGA